MLQARSRAARLVAVLGAGVVALAAPHVASAQDDGERHVYFDAFEGVPPEWTAVLNGYVYDPVKYGPRLIAIEREGGAGLPPMFRMAAADAQLRAGNRRAAERILEQSLAAGEGYPWEDFANLGMGTMRLASGDEAGAELYFGRLADAHQESSQALGSLGLGATYAASGRFAEAQAAFDAASAIATDPEVRNAGQLGSALALHGAGDDAAAAAAFDALAEQNPDGTLGEDARYAAARARLALGERDQAEAELRELVKRCDARRSGRRAPRALRNLDARAMGRDWLRSYRKTGWANLRAGGRSMFSLDGCSLARSTVHALERNDARLTSAQTVSTGRSQQTAVAPLPDAVAPRPPQRTEEREDAGSGSSALTLVIALAAAVAAAIVWRLALRRTAPR